MLDKTSFQNSLSAILSDLSAGNTASSKAAQLATAIETYIKSGQVTVTNIAPGTFVTAAGGPVTGLSGSGTGLIT